MKMNSKLRVFENHSFFFGRMISGSKSYYVDKFPDHKVVFNARIYDEETYGKEKDSKIKDFFKGQEIEIWYGDLDLTIDTPKLKQVAKEIGTFVITTESGEYVTKVQKEG